MFRVEGKHHLWKHFLTVVFASILLAPLGMSTNQAFAMGQAPSTCPNRYDSTITQMILNNGTHILDPIQNPGTTFRAEAHSGYSISMTLHTADQSSNGNQDRGTTWYSYNGLGFGNGVCTDDVGPNEDKILDLSHQWNFAGLGPPKVQSVSWNTIPSAQVTYTVDWYDGNAPPAANDAPMASDDSASTDEDTPITIAVLDNDSDPNGDPLTITSVSTPASGTVVINADNTITYTPNEDFFGTDSFTYTISDGNGGTAIATVFVTINPVNDPPGAGDDFAETTVISVTIDVLANDVDLEGDPLTVDSIVIAPQNGQATINSDNTITYTPNLGFIGRDTFEYMVSDGNGGTDTALVSIAVNEIVGPIPIPISILPL